MSPQYILFVFSCLVSVPHDISAGELDRMEKTRDRSSVKTIISSLLSTTETNAVNMPLWVSVCCLSSGDPEFPWGKLFGNILPKTAKYEKISPKLGEASLALRLDPPLLSASTLAQTNVKWDGIEFNETRWSSAWNTHHAMTLHWYIKPSA